MTVASFFHLQLINRSIFTKCNVLMSKIDTLTVLHKNLIVTPEKHFSTTERKLVKENDVTIIEGKPSPSPREGKVINVPNPTGACPVCRLNLEIKYTDVLILSQFLRSDGCPLPCRITGLCKKQHKNIVELIAQAQKAGLMSNLRPINNPTIKGYRPYWNRCNSNF